MSHHDRKHLQDLIRILEKHLKELEIQRAGFGEPHTPPHISIGIKNAQAEINQLEDELRRIDEGSGGRSPLRIDVVIGVTIRADFDKLLDKLPGYREVDLPGDDPPSCCAVKIWFTGKPGTYDAHILLVGRDPRKANQYIADAIKLWRPTYTLLLGAIGGINGKNVNIGDILLTEGVVRYNQETPARPFQVQPDEPPSGIKDFSNGRLLKSITKIWPDSGVAVDPRCHTGLIISGVEAVSQLDALRQQSDIWPDVFGVETEAFGMADVVFQYHNVYMIGGISSRADLETAAAESKQWRSLAIATAVAYTIELLKSRPFPPRISSPEPPWRRYWANLGMWSYSAALAVVLLVLLGLFRSGLLTGAGSSSGMTTPATEQIVASASTTAATQPTALDPTQAPGADEPTASPEAPTVDVLPTVSPAAELPTPDAQVLIKNPIIDPCTQWKIFHAPVSSPAISVTIAIAVPLSGPSQAKGLDMLRAACLAYSNLGNDLGNNRKLRLIAFDDQGDQKTVREAVAQKIVADPSIQCVVGHRSSTVSLAALPEYRRENLVMISPSNSNPDITDGTPNVAWRLAGNDIGQAAAAVYFIRNHDWQKDIQRVLIIHDHLTTTTQLAENFQERARITALSSDSLPYKRDTLTDTRELDTLMKNVQDFAPPDLIFFSTNSVSDTIAFIDRVRDPSSALQAVPILTVDGVDSPELNKSGFAEVYFSTMAMPPDDAKMKGFTERFVAAFQDFGVSRDTIQAYVAETYDATSICRQAIADAPAVGGGTSERAKVLLAMEDMPHKQDNALETAMTGPYFFRNDHNFADRGYYFIRKVGQLDPIARYKCLEASVSDINQMCKNRE